MRFIILLGLSILLSGCGTTTNYYTQTAQSWKGASLNSLSKSWGRPDQTVADRQGSTIYVYKSESYQRSNTMVSPSMGVNNGGNGRPVIVSDSNANANWNRNMSLSCVTYFIANSKHVITDVKTAGNNCFGGASYSSRMSNPANMVVTTDKSL
jgi:hypothetical protein